ncbi:hypothetical protein ERUR111494_04615 [Erysipelothrix urinaevulpis]|uniref:hypothetical protein n=1 Tax=Erysipelothrix urinaevulpis TaxID=2683717 RepID=UPI00135BB1DA|nr:hypothetical protein [Erysipelothrix urinaevulpis]
MEKIISFMRENPFIWYYVALMLISLIIGIVSMRKAKAKKDGFLDLHPDAARLILNQKGFISSTIISVHEVNNEAVQENIAVMGKLQTKESQYFSEKMTHGLLLKPGVNKLLVSYENTRPGIMHKSVTTYSDPEYVEIECKANTRYRLNFNTDTHQFGVEVAE